VKRLRAKLSPRAIVLILALCAVLLPGIYPVREYWAARRHAAELRQHNANAVKRVASLTAELERLRSDAELERIAREELGYVRPGERSYVVVDPPRPKTARR
jgi:cell division protein FtsB